MRAGSPPQKCPLLSAKKRGPCKVTSEEIRQPFFLSTAPLSTFSSSPTSLPYSLPPFLSPSFPLPSFLSSLLPSSFPHSSLPSSPLPLPSLPFLPIFPPPSLSSSLPPIFTEDPPCCSGPQAGHSYTERETLFCFLKSSLLIGPSSGGQVTILPRDPCPKEGLGWFSWEACCASRGRESPHRAGEI